jgi:hypothetical protein
VNSVAVVIEESSDVVFERGALIAGDGADGEVVPFDPPGLPTPGNGQQPDGTGQFTRGNAGVGGMVECPSGQDSRGGDGGSTIDGEASPGSHGEPADLDTPDPEGGDPGEPAASTMDIGICTAHDGNPGTDGAHGEAATKVGELSGTQWLPSAGGSGEDGSNGQGGGGGGGWSTLTIGNGGSGGGAGACGGLGSPGGTGGGASIALISVDSSVVLNGTKLETGTAGDGADASEGQAGGETGGAPGSTPEQTEEILVCAGGFGGPGGNGGTGAGGTGGSTFGILFSGTEPTLDDAAEIDLGPAGDAGQSPGNDGRAGIARDVFEGV